MGTSERDPNQKALVLVFTRALADTGWKEGINIRIERRWGEGNAALLRTKAAELARFRPDWKPTNEKYFTVHRFAFEKPLVG